MLKTLSFEMKNENYNRNEIVTVKFRTDSNETLTQAFELKTNIGSLRLHLHLLFNVDSNKIVIEREESVLQDDQTLKELGATSLGIFELGLRGDGIRLQKPTYYLPVVDVIMVNIKQKTLVVEIEHCSIDKPWLGGYRDRNNGKKYHHATAQTDFKPKIYSNIVQVDRQSQTCVDKGIDNTAFDKWTQTADVSDGKLLLAKPYFSYQAWLQEDYVLTSVLMIQRAFRRMVTRKRLSQPTTVKIEQQKIVVTTTELEAKQQNFYSLYTMIGKWWKKERQRIKEIKAEKSRKAAQINLLKKEIKFLMEVEKQRSELKYELTKHDDITFLNKTSKPKMFKNKTGKLLTMDTVGNQKARVLKNIYMNIIAAGHQDARTLGTSQSRAEVLDELYIVVSRSCYKYKKNLMDAIAMEKDFAEMRVDMSSMLSVRRRVEQMFRHFIRQPEVNPEADLYYRPSEKRILNIYTCIRCKRNLAATDFSLESRVNRTNVCANCEWTEQVSSVMTF